MADGGVVTLTGQSGDLEKIKMGYLGCLREGWPGKEIVTLAKSATSRERGGNQMFTT
jgi:hypothetical protein